MSAFSIYVSVAEVHSTDFILKCPVSFILKFKEIINFLKE